MDKRFLSGVGGMGVAAVLLFANAAPAGWFDKPGEDGEKPKSLILGEKEPKLEKIPAGTPQKSTPTSPAPYSPREQNSYTSPYAASSCASPTTMPYTTDYFAEDCPCWSIRAGAVFLHRSQTASETLFTYTPAATPINTDVFNLGTVGGYDLGLTYRLTDCYDLDFRFFGVNSWSSTVNFAADDFSTVALGYPLITAGSPISMSYDSNLYSNELNGRKWVSDSWAWTGGVRWFEMSEQFVGTVTGVGNFAAIDTNNHLFGGQVGGMWRKQYESWYFQANGSVGIYGNSARVNAYAPIFADQASYSRGHTAFAGDLSFVGAYRLTKYMWLRAGYQMLWLDGVALAPNQANNLDVPTRTGAIDFGSAFYHGATVGFDITW